MPQDSQSGQFRWLIPKSSISPGLQFKLFKTYKHSSLMIWWIIQSRNSKKRDLDRPKPSAFTQPFKKARIQLHQRTENSSPTYFFSPTYFTNIHLNFCSNFSPTYKKLFANILHQHTFKLLYSPTYIFILLANFWDISEAVLLENSSIKKS